MSLPHQHGPGISPTSDELAERVGRALAPFGGERFVTPDVSNDPLTRRLVESGRVWDQPVEQAPGSHYNACHDVAAAIRASNPGRFTHVYGYALSDDLMWRSHSWIHDRRGDRLLEPTPVGRTRYFGVGLTKAESEGPM